MRTFAQLIAPITIDDFLEKFWRKSPLYIAKDMPVDEILSVEEINSYLGRESIIYPFVRIVGNGSEIDVKKYQLDPNGSFNLINKTTMFKLFNEGNSIVIQAGHFQFPNLNRFVKNLEEELRVDINANIYITSSNSRGFHPHFDTHEVFVLQISGSKAWNLYDIPSVAPIKGWGITEDQRSEYLKSKPLHELTLQIGDLLYVPRGVVHDAYCQGESSIHITFGFNPMVRLEVLNELVKRAEHHAYFREPYLPLNKNLTENDKAILIQEATKILSAILENMPSYKNYEIKYRDTKNIFYITLLIDNATGMEELQELFESLEYFENDIILSDDEFAFLQLVKNTIVLENETNWTIDKIKIIMKSLVLKGKLFNTEAVEA
jgi:ribosomal protein L16 Arg81 hydroxylase